MSAGLTPGAPSGTFDDQALNRARARAEWLKTLLKWHWISSAICLVGLMLFALTGITLNHAGLMEASPTTTRRTLELPPPLKAALSPLGGDAASESGSAAGDDSKGRSSGTDRPVPRAVAEWLETQLRVELPIKPDVEWSEDELYVSLPRPGGDAWLRVNLASGGVEFESTDRGWVAYLNDLHKGRHTGGAWTWFIDIFAAACLVFAVTGLLILQLHAKGRPLTWPIVGLGLVVPLLLAILFIH